MTIAPKVNVPNWYMPKKGNYEKKTQVWPFFWLLKIGFILSAPYKISSKFCYNIIYLPWALPFSTRAPFFASPNVGLCQWIMSADDVDLRIYLWGHQTPGSHWPFFLGVNWSGPGTSSTTNHKFYRALGRLHGPWCKQPLRNKKIGMFLCWLSVTQGLGINMHPLYFTHNSTTMFEPVWYF